MNVNVRIESNCYQWCPRRLRFLCCCCASPDREEQIQQVAQEALKTEPTKDRHKHRKSKPKDPDDVPRGTKKPS